MGPGLGPKKQSSLSSGKLIFLKNYLFLFFSSITSQGTARYQIETSDKQLRTTSVRECAFIHDFSTPSKKRVGFGYDVNVSNGSLSQTDPLPFNPRVRWISLSQTDGIFCFQPILIWWQKFLSYLNTSMGGRDTFLRTFYFQGDIFDLVPDAISSEQEAFANFV